MCDLSAGRAVAEKAAEDQLAEAGRLAVDLLRAGKLPASPVSTQWCTPPQPGQRWVNPSVAALIHCRYYEAPGQSNGVIATAVCSVAAPTLQIDLFKRQIESCIWRHFKGETSLILPLNGGLNKKIDGNRS